VADALRDQVALLAAFSAKFGKPKRTIAWGHSLGGIITAGLVQLHPELFAAALPMCGVLAGGVANWNGALDIGFATQVLLDPQLQVVNIIDPGANLARARTAVTAANATPQGKARLAMIAALGYLPGWFNPLNPEPPAGDFAAQQANQATWESFDFTYVFAFRAELEKRAGGNPSWNTGVDYGRAFAGAPGRLEVEALYRQAGLDPAADLARVQAAPRISADAAAVDYLDKNITFNGTLAVPVLTLHTTGDGLVVVENEAAYADVVAAGRDGGMLRQLYVHRANHCIFTPAEQIAAFQVLFDRLDNGSWPATNPAALNSRAAALGAKYNGGSLPGSANPIAVPSAFVDFTPPAFPRQFDSRSPRP
jgi:pimeloyl-ACP methyl ester carboxylesterase